MKLAQRFGRNLHAISNEDSAAGDDTATSAAPIRFFGASAVLGPGVTLHTNGRYRIATPTEHPLAVVFDPCGPDEVRRRRAEFPTSALVVWDRRPAAGPATVAAALEAGVDAFVCSEHLAVLVAHLDALARRPHHTDVLPAS